MTAATLVGGNNGGWTKLSSSTNGSPGFASFKYCFGGNTNQCSYDMPVYSPPGSPNIVYIGGALQYPELGRRSNGRGIQRSQDAGVNFTDMTIDTHGVSLHPDQHAIASTPGNPDIVFIGNDGGLWRLNGSFTNASSQVQQPRFDRCGFNRLPTLALCHSYLDYFAQQRARNAPVPESVEIRGHRQ